MIDSNDIIVTMTAILSTMFAILGGLIYIQTPAKTGTSSFYPNPKTEPSKYAYEMYQTFYSPIWMAIFGIIVIFQLYETWSAREYNLYLFLLALPCVLQPILIPSAFFSSPDAKRPLKERYATKANIWLAVYAFIGNYWYTHYFYSVLKANYSMPSTRLNNVPIAMFFATMFYFSSYHIFSNAMLRKIKTSFEPGMKRRILYLSTVFVLSYFTAFMETLTISSFPYYSFEDRNMAYTVGSAFYGIYFLVSFPAFLEFDRDVDMDIGNAGAGAGAKVGKKVTCWETVVESCGYGMMIMCLLDFVRLYLGVPLTVGV
jgi:cycloeucalenol cycloisomerase